MSMMRAILAARDGAGTLFSRAFFTNDNTYNQTTSPTFAGNASVDSSGTLIDPASKQDIQALIAIEAPTTGFIPMAAGATVAAGRTLHVYCTAPGDIYIKAADGTTDTVAAQAGSSFIAAEIIEASIPTGSTFAGSFTNWK